MKSERKLHSWNVPTSRTSNIGRHLRRRQAAALAGENARLKERLHRAMPVIGIMVLMALSFIGGYATALR